MEEQVTREEFEALEKRVADLEQKLQSRPEQEKAIDQSIRECLTRFDELLKRSFEGTQSYNSPSS